MTTSPLQNHSSGFRTVRPASEPFVQHPTIRRLASWLRFRCWSGCRCTERPDRGQRDLSCSELIPCGMPRSLKQHDDSPAEKNENQDVANGENGEQHWIELEQVDVEVGIEQLRERGDHEHKHRRQAKRATVAA